MQRLRILLTTTGHAGHVLPLVPFARAWQRAGHEILVAAPRSRTADVERAGLPLRTFEEPSEEAVAPIWAATLEADPEEANELVIGAIFAGHKKRAALPGILDIVADWEPDVIVRESYEFASVLAAEHYGIPHVRIGPGLASTEEYLNDLALAAAPDLPADAIRDSPFLTLNPPELDDPAAPSPARIHRFRSIDNARGRLPNWWPGNDDPLVYLSFGSVAGAMDFLFPRVYRVALEQLAELPARILVTIGNAREPLELGPQPANVRVERWVPQADVAARAGAMVVHGGYGTVHGALCAGVPLVVAPLFADQPHNARRVAELGAGIALPAPGSLGRLADQAPELFAELGLAVEHVLVDARYRRAARRVAMSASTLRPVHASVGVLLAAVAESDGELAA
jgi:UDP:flavonoid glycosyltransferase YjiC (YdhE family)